MADALKKAAEHAASDVDPRLLLGLAVGSGFLCVCLCSLCIWAKSQLAKRRASYSSLPEGASGQAAETEEQEREQILSEVYGRPERDALDEEDQDQDKEDDDDELNKAWDAIRRAESSGDEDVDNLISMEDFPESFSPKSKDAEEGTGVQQPQRARRGRPSFGGAVSSGATSSGSGHQR
mmetsp:Transcript_41795/g.112704  ORF Transcript_41795/g.112704 Transcript_41795/m.112704 type:complete len:179 (-) Transcript_41795:42-578(-)